MPELNAPIEKLMHEHQTIETEVQELESHLLQHLGSKRADSRNKSLDAHCRRYVKKLLTHLQFEETEVFPHTDALRRRDWLAVDKGLAHEPDPLFGAEVKERYEELADALAGRVEGISESMTYSDVLSLGAVANSVETLGAGLASMRDQQIELVKAVGKTQRQVFSEALDEKSPWALAKLPISLTKANLALAKENTVKSFETAKRVARDVGESWRRAREAP
jgi:hypothetical protein